MLIAVLNGNQPLRPNRHAGFFLHFFDGVGRYRLQHIDPTARKRPPAVIFPYQQDFFPL